MKKIISTILILTLVFSLCGCLQIENLKNVELPPLPDVDAQATAEPIPTVPVVDTSESVAESTLPQHVIVRVDKYSEQHYDPQNGEILILDFSYETPRVYIEGRDEASNAINEYIATVDETFYTGNDYGVTSEYDIRDGAISGVNAMLEAAIDNYSYAAANGLADLPLEYSAARTARVERIDSRVLCVVYNTYTYTGGAHGNSFDRGYAFDAESGEVLTLDNLSADTDSFLDFLKEYIFNIYTEDENGYYFSLVYEDMTDEVAEEAVKALVRDGSWYFNGEGIVFFSSLYELGSYTSGIIKFTVPYSALEGQMYDKYLLPQHDTDAGTFELKAQSDVADGSIEIIDKVTVNADGEALCLEAVGTVYDVRLSTVDYTDQFYETAQLWAVSYMSDCVLQLETLIPDGMPNLMVSYLDAQGSETCLLLSQSGEDGGYTLIDKNSIEAVG